MNTSLCARRIAMRCVGIVAVACATATAAIGQEIRRDPLRLDNPIQVYPLPDDALIEHRQYEGVVRRLDARNKETTRVKIPAAGPIATRTTLILSADRSRVLMVHTADDDNFLAKHKVAILDTARLRTIAELPLGKCWHHGPGFPLAAEHVTMVCYHSRPPDDRSRKPTLAVVTIDMNRGEVVRWFPLGGERRGSWFGPMFFGWHYDVTAVDVREKKECPFVATIAEPAAERLDDLHQILVLDRSKGPDKGEVWFVGKRPTEAPRRIAVLPRPPGSAVLCRAESSDAAGRLLLYVTEQLDFRAETPPPQRIDVVDIASGKLIAQ
jgi:hypothetical protein